MKNFIEKDMALKKVSFDTEAYQAINMIPSIDAVEVVRCKDCSYHTLCAIEHEVKFDEEFFCKWGEEKR